MILLFCLKYRDCVPLPQHAVPLIWTALLVPKGYCLDIATIALCFSFNMNAKRALHLGYVIRVKMRFLLALSICVLLHIQIKAEVGAVKPVKVLQ